MNLFHCTSCGGLIFFENSKCVQCGHSLAFLPDTLEMGALERGPNGGFMALGGEADQNSYRQCCNASHGACNWAIPAGEDHSFCLSCRLNVLIPDLGSPKNRELWHKLELAKRRLLYTLLSLRLPLSGEPSLRFQFPAQMPGAPNFQTGHDQGLITINLAEADDAVRESLRVSLHEPFRTPLGHFRHEIGHYYWDRLIKNSPHLESFRKIFGDERQNYKQALERHYCTGPAPDWSTRCVSAYASAHPWEDWAETWAHCLHILDTLETAASFGLRPAPVSPITRPLADFPETANDRGDFDAALEAWMPLTCALNSFNRGMGLVDLYPFVLNINSMEKLRFAHRILMENAAPAQENAPAPLPFPPQPQARARAVG